MCPSICLFYYSFLFHIRFHVGQDGHGAHEHVQRTAAHAQLHHGQQPAYATPGPQPDLLLLLHAAHQSIGEWTEL